ncbi:uncharacterized protein LOC121853927 [Homarus americanus]|uniref:uncharacterized protein LOC121853927 n=1 Tax=Homarus americanus TaxID=6706 RepID=UPI001C438FF0|nr:uncharacterized protein LOC121853927 [Homarus americanus]
MTFIAKNRLTRRSELYRLEPYMSEHGLMMVGGRLHREWAATHDGPILLPRDHPVTTGTLIVRETHAVHAEHSGREHTFSLLRQNFGIPKCRGLLDKISKACTVCRRNNWVSMHQREALLPADRTCPGKPAFAFTG